MRLIDRYMAAYQFREIHARRVTAAPASILSNVAAYRADSDPFFRIANAVREWPARLRDRRDAPRQAFGIHTFTKLEETESEIVYGLVGRFWTADYGLRPIADGTAFRAFDADDAAKLVLGFRTQPEQGGTLLVTETRVWCPNRSVRLRFTPYWLLIRPVSGLARRRMLASIARDSKGRARICPDAAPTAAGKP
ncbi:hypothetical protein MKK88_20190 [Methylobacterium sp. E-005]|uniref:hypothetical protein n=1 Tax=Methylobacterium sp. E-005 TaxID=2836549 RepID=UPI001FBB9D07|nr:hypothetical protein [Methylobacterium sp. E-005]MCJ2088286.1 hypothetical protein [Methylobacterium sp. E-005]